MEWNLFIIPVTNILVELIKKNKDCEHELASVDCRRYWRRSRRDLCGSF